jgi:hypothetical protein
MQAIMLTSFPFGDHFVSRTYLSKTSKNAGRGRALAIVPVVSLMIAAETKKCRDVLAVDYDPVAHLRVPILIVRRRLKHNKY